MATMMQALPEASEATKKGFAEVWEELTGYPEAELIAALEEQTKARMRRMMKMMKMMWTCSWLCSPQHLWVHWRG